MMDYGTPGFIEWYARCCKPKWRPVVYLGNGKVGDSAIVPMKTPLTRGGGHTVARTIAYYMDIEVSTENHPRGILVTRPG